MLKASHGLEFPEAGCDEAGRGCLAGPVFAAAVILPEGFSHPKLNDSKQLNAATRADLRLFIEANALAWSVASVEPEIIDKVNILQASFLAMNMAVENLTVTPRHLIIDGNRFRNRTEICYSCIVKGDAIYASIAAASILAKTHRDAYMLGCHELYPYYSWNTNFGYPTAAHRKAIRLHGLSPLHRRSFNTGEQLKMEF